MSGMIDIGGKEIIRRSALAAGHITLSDPAVEAIRSGTVRKGNCLEVARASALLAVKHTHLDIVHCHPIPIESVTVEFNITDTGVDVNVRVRAEYRTGVEMEALSGVSRALLTIWDMVKYLEKDGDGQYPSTRISDIRVVEKIKG